MKKTKSVKNRVSIWIGCTKPASELKRTDILRELYDIKYYNLDDQEVAGKNSRFPKAPIAEILSMFSYSSSFLTAALQATQKVEIVQAYWGIAQFDFEFRPSKKYAIAEGYGLVFLGVFDWNDSEDDI